MRHVRAISQFLGRGLFTASNAANIRNLALVAHIDSGKTTLTESILHASSYLATPGSVDTGSTTTDFLPAERERGITIQSASIPVQWKQWTFNLIDTPGHPDFGMEVESASRVIDGAVVLMDAVEGVEAQTKGVWQQLNRYQVGARLLFLNKLDRPGASTHASLKSILAHKLHSHPLLLSMPVTSFDKNAYETAEPGLEGLVDLVQWKLWKWDDEKLSIHRLPSHDKLVKSDLFSAGHPLFDELLKARSTLLEQLSMHSEPLMNELLTISDSSDDLSLAVSEILKPLREATQRGDILPVVCGSALHHRGTELLMDYIGELLPSPLEVSVSLKTGHLEMIAWKVVWDARKGWMTYVRVYSGALQKQSAIFNRTRNQKERASKLLLLYASQPKEVDTLPFGSVGVVLGLRYTRTGDTLVSSNASNTNLASPSLTITPPPAVISASIIPQSQADADTVQESIIALARTDPSVRVGQNEGQLVIHGLGELHLEIVANRLREEWDARFETGPLQVGFREGFGGHAANPEEVWTTNMSGQTYAVSLVAELRSLDDYEDGDDAWDGNVVLGPGDTKLLAPDNLGNSASPLKYLSQGIWNALSSSPHTSLGISRMYVAVKSFSYPNNAPHSILNGAAVNLIRRRVREAGQGYLMEPFVSLRVNVEDQYLGQVLRDLAERRAEIQELQSDEKYSEGGTAPFSADGIYIPPDWANSCSASSVRQTVETGTYLRKNVFSHCPLSRLLDYSTRLRALSGGHGTFETRNIGYRRVDHEREQEILRELGRL